MKSIYRTLIVLCLPVIMMAQGAKVQTAWRNLDDYNNSKDVSSLMKAKEAIDLATNHENTKEDAKTWMYRAQIYYALFKNGLEQEAKKLKDANPPAKDLTPKQKKEYDSEMLTKAYGNVSTADYMTASMALMKVGELDKAKNYTGSMEFLKLGGDMQQDVNNLAVGKFQVGKYDEAAKYFEGTYMAMKFAGQKDTAAMSNALVCAIRMKDPAKIREYNEKIIKEKIATGYNYVSLYEAQLALKDSSGAAATLKEGRTLFPNDVDLLNRETDTYLKKGKDAEALANLDQAIAKAPNSPVLYMARGNIYDKQANPIDATTKREADKPKNYEDLMAKAETNYKKATEIDPKMSDAWYNLGALYNGWANNNLQLCDNLVKQAAKMKECEAKATEKYMKAISALETVLELNPGDRSTMKYLHKLYIRTEQTEKATKMKEAIDKK